MSNNITINTNQSPYFDDFDDDKNYHQVLYKPSLPVQARELTTQQSILRDQVKKFGDHVFKNGSKVSGGELVLNLDYEYIKLKPQYNGVDINVANFVGKTIVGTQTGSKALVLGTSAVDSTTGDPDTLFVKYITGGSQTDKVQGIRIINQGSGYTVAPAVAVAGGGTGVEAEAIISGGAVIGVDIINRGSGYTSNATDSDGKPIVTVQLTGGTGSGATAQGTLETSPAFLAGERLYATDRSISAEIVDAEPTSIRSITITNGGAGYTEPPAVTIANAPSSGTNATALATITNGVVTEITVVNQGAGYSTSSGGATPTVTIAAAPAGGVNATGESVLSTAVGTGSSTSISEGVFYINGNFIKVPAQTLILDKYFDNPSYKIGLTVAETVVNAGGDISLLDNAQGSSNFAAPGADRLKLSLTLTKKTLDSEDDVDFYELLRVNKGVKEKDIKVPIYSVLEETFARRTFDESGSYTVRSFNIQLKDHPSDDSKFLVRLDPGKAFIEGFEFETLVSQDLELDKAREVVNVNGFSRLMQFGNYVIVKDLIGLFNLSVHQEVDLHNVTTSNIVDTNYANTKIGTAKVRSVDFSSSTGGANRIFNLYIYDVQMTSDKFENIESVVIPVDASAGTVVLRSSADIDDSGKVNADPSKDTILNESNFNSLVFKYPQDVIKSIRGLNDVIDTGYPIKRVFGTDGQGVTFNGGTGAISSAGSSEKFIGTGSTLSDSNARENYLVVVKDPQGSGLAPGSIVRFDQGGTITISNTGTSATFNTGVTGTGGTFKAEIIATLNVSSKQERVKSLVASEVKPFATPSTSDAVWDTLEFSDIWKLRAVYDSEDSNTAPTLPTLTVASTAQSLQRGETITGQTSGAKGLVIVGNSGTTTITYVPVSGTFVASENVTGATTGFTKTISGVVVGSTDITSRYMLDNGQRDNIYDHGAVKLKSGETAPTGQISVVFDYFTHTGNGYLSVDSYTGSVSFADIPAFTSPVSGDEVELRDCIDFRPRRADGGTTIENIELPVPNEDFTSDYSYYLPRVDTIYLSKERKFGNNTGVSSLTATPPATLDGTMNLYTLNIPAYTFNAKDIRAEYIENKRYTMRDIGKLEKRISNVEYYTSLSLLEKDAEALDIKDAATGLDRFKNGILVDGFNGHSVGNVLNPDYQCSIDFDDKILRPRFISNIVDVQYKEEASTGVAKTGDCITLPYNTIPFVKQPIASKAVNINPFAVLAWVGTVDLTPPNDNWIDTSTNPEVVVNLQGENDAWSSLVGLAFGTQFNDWQTLGTGRERVVAQGGTFRRGNAIQVNQTVEREVTQTRTGIRNEITGVDTVRNSIGDRVVDVSVIPFIRARNITVNVTGMKPNTRVYARFDGEDVNVYCTPNGGTLGGAIFTDDAGSISNLTFSIPNTDTLRFRSGERQFLLTDNQAGDLITAGTYAEVVYQAQGLLQTRENVVLSTRVPTIQTFAQGSATEFRTTTNTFNRVNTVGWVDPLAETFLVDPALYPDGVFLTDVELFFKTKDEDGIPVTLQIRDTLNGYPAQTIVPFSNVTKFPADITVSEDASVATKFAFPSLVYLQPGEYSIVVISNSLKYETYIAEMGENIVGTDRKISEQPYAGVFFKSQNASTWTPEQNQDLSFNINIAEFVTNTDGNAVFRDFAGVSYDAKADLIQLVPQEIRINKTNIKWGVKMKDDGDDSFDVEYRPLIQNTNFILDSRKKVEGLTQGSFESRATLSSSSKYISPVIDTARNSVITIQNIINNTADADNILSGGDATARYLTRRVTLKDGFDATSLQVFLTANRQGNSKISVYYKVLSQFDSDLFDNKAWTLMKEASNVNSKSISDDDSEYLELEFVPNTVNGNITYTRNTVNYTSFKIFAVKIVMTTPSSETTRVPLIKDLRAIALA